MAQPLIDLVNISKSFDNTMVLDDLNLSVKENSFVTLLGPSGCGKSTLLRCVNALEEIQGGSVTLDFTGWKQVTFANLGDWYEILGLQVSVPATAAGEGLVYADTPRTGTIYIDHITATASGTPDNAAPVVSASLDNSLWQVAASVACRRAA